MIAELSTLVRELAIEVPDVSDRWFRAVATQRWDDLMEAELAERRRTAYPPAVTLALIRSPQLAALTAVRAALPTTARCLGPVARRDSKGHQLLVKLPQRALPSRWFEPLAKQGLLRTVRIELDPFTDSFE
jgi:primosomal protein N'